MILLVAMSGAIGCAGTDTGKTSTTTGTALPAETTPLPPAPLDAGKQIYVYAPEVGDCFDKRTSDGTTGNANQNITLKLDCDKPHVDEIFAVIEAPMADPKVRTYPGEEALRKFAKTACPKTYDDYLGAPYELSKLEIGYLIPSESGWPGYRKIGCYVYDASERGAQGVIDRRTSGSSRGSKR